jgi:hypothetical protein
LPLDTNVVDTNVSDEQLPVDTNVVDSNVSDEQLPLDTNVSDEQLPVNQVPINATEMQDVKQENNVVPSSENDNLAAAIETITKKIASEFAEQFASKFTGLNNGISNTSQLQNPFISNEDAANTMGKQGGTKYTRKFRISNKKNKTITK